LIHLITNKIQSVFKNEYKKLIDEESLKMGQITSLFLCEVSTNLASLINIPTCLEISELIYSSCWIDAQLYFLDIQDCLG
jgi:hypothetical protein